MSWLIVLNLLNACGTSVDAQLIVGADNPAVSAMTVCVGVVLRPV